MQRTIVVGKQTIYTILRQMPFSWGNKWVHYLCRNGWGDYVLLYVNLDGDLPKDFGTYLFLIRNACLHAAILSGHTGHESWAPIVEEVVTIPMGFAEKQGLIFRLDIKDVDKLVPLRTIIGSNKWLDVPTIFWLIRELALFLKVTNEYDIYADLYAGGILVNPEERRLVFYDFNWIGKRTKETYNVDDGQWAYLTKLCWEILGFGRYSSISYQDYKFVGDYEDGLLEELGAILSYKRNDLDYLKKMVCAWAENMLVDNCPFAMQDEPSVRKKVEKPEDDDESDEGNESENDESEDDESDEENENGE